MNQEDADKVAQVLDYVDGTDSWIGERAMRQANARWEGQWRFERDPDWPSTNQGVIAIREETHEPSSNL